MSLRPSIDVDGSPFFFSPVAAKKKAVRTMVAHGARSLLVKLLNMKCEMGFSKLLF